MTPLNQNELEALRILWAESDLKPGEIQERFAWKIDNGTLRSVLVRLVEEGHATRRPEGKAFRYAAHVPKQTLLQAMVQSIARVFAGGSPRELVSQMVETGDVKASDLKVISEVAAGKERQTKRKTK
jgi:BlaI family transcriptional regulator, penicillinase repressor